jgi:predicted aspartyl protease
MMPSGFLSIGMEITELLFASVATLWMRLHLFCDSLGNPEIMSEEMGTFRTVVAIENPLRRGDRRELPDTLVDTGAELTWAPTVVLEGLGITRQKRLGFRTADGRAVFRDVGYAIVHAGGTETNDEVVFAEEGDMILLGARSLEGLNLRVDPRLKQLVDAGPIIAAVA